VNLSKPENIPDYIIKAGQTPVYLIELAPMEYVVVFVKDDLKRVRKVDLSKANGKKKPIEITEDMK
jgi:hypothetical protein